MSMPPQPPQGPYGPPQPPQNPYGQQPPAAPGPYPPQTPPPPYGYPQQQPQGAPGPWGAHPGMQPGMQPGVPGCPQPPRKSRTGLVLGIVAGGLVLVTALGFGVYQLIDKGADAAFPEATHKLVVEKTMLDGEFTLSQDMSATEGRKIENTPDPSIRDGRAAVAQYTSDEGGALVLSGMYGRLSSPSFMRGKIMEGAATADGAKVMVPAEEFRPAGYDITVECQVVQSSNMGVSANVPMCAWGDDNTAAMIALVRPDQVTKDARSIDLEKAAEETAKVRTEIRKPLS
ncbi:hypothetical protein [Streptomyces nitrosporeus]|uniref:hypothetical protein n=1 Tax=Streptomyces nitrosporeus TaxID=28894 RepID=UPI0039A360C2